MSRCKAMDWGKYEKLIRDGFGRGTFENYRPWLHIRRGNSSPVSNQVTGAALPGQDRLCTFLSRTEWLIALLCYWIGALDCREQFPCWPHAHPHPLTELPLAKDMDLPESRGLWEIAKSAGIEHGTYVGSTVPCPVTTDLLITLPGKDRPRLAALPVKAYSMIRDAEPSDRMLARLELERLYHEELNNYCKKVVTEKIVTEVLGGQLVEFSAAARLPKALDYPMLIVEFAGRINELAYTNPICDSVRKVGNDMRISFYDATRLFNHSVWKRLLDIDLSVPVVRSYPAKKGGYKLAEVLRKEMFGEFSEN